MADVYTQMPLIPGMPPVDLSGSAPTRTKEEGLRRVATNMNAEWGTFAYRCLLQVASRKVEFTSDDVDAEIESYEDRPVTHEKRALGALMTRAARQGIIIATDRIVPSTRRKLHNSPRRVWQSMVYGAGSVASENDFGAPAAQETTCAA